MSEQMNQPGYEHLANILQAAYEQAAVGKGAERHAGGQPFDAQPMQSISDLFDSPYGMAFQVTKKLHEGLKMDTLERQERELLGAINYTAGIILWLRRQAGQKPLEVAKPVQDEDRITEIDKEVAALGGWCSVSQFTMQPNARVFFKLLDGTRGQSARWGNLPLSTQNLVTHVRHF